MSVDFFETGCKEKSRNEKLFGLCDDQDGTKAYSNVGDDKKWIAKIVNQGGKEIAFTAIDNCIIVLKTGTNNVESSCDGMLTFTQSLYLVELKKRGKGGWVAKAKGQLENTIKLIATNHDLSRFQYKKAYACNKKHPSFTVINPAERKSFFQKNNGFRFDVQAEIIVK